MTDPSRPTAPSGRGKPNDPRALPRMFEMFRHEDVTGYSGVGVVAYGVEWPDGSVAFRWRGPVPSTVVFEAGLVAVREVHGHGGATEIRWLDPGNARAPDASDGPSGQPDDADETRRLGTAWERHDEPHPPPWPPPDQNLPPGFPRP